MEIFDCFCGLGPWAHRDRLLPYEDSEILALMDHFGIRRALTHSSFTAGGGAPIHGNQLLAESANKMPVRFVPAFTFMPGSHDDSPGVAGVLSAMRTAGAKAVWMTISRETGPVGWVYDEQCEACVAHRVPVLIHMDFITPDGLDQLLGRHPAMNCILVGVGYAADWWIYPLLRRHACLHLALGQFYVPADNPQRFLRHFSAERLLFGSALPHFSPGGLITHIMYGAMTDDDREKIMHGNLERLLAEVRL